MWEALGEQTVDVLIIGGGINGAGIARDAAKRGLSVALVDMNDLASGTSSSSSKLIHGGIRYLEQLEFGLVFSTDYDIPRLHAAAGGVLGLELLHAGGELLDAGVLFVALVFEEQHLVDDLGEGALGFFEFAAAIDAMLVLENQHLGRDLVRWPGLGEDGPLYGFSSAPVA